MSADSSSAATASSPSGGRAVRSAARAAFGVLSGIAVSITTRRFTQAAGGWMHSTPEPAGELRVEAGGLIRHVEEVDLAGFQRVLGTDDQQAVLVDQLFEDLRAVAQVIRGDADVGADRALDQRRVVRARIG